MGTTAAATRPDPIETEKPAKKVVSISLGSSKRDKTVRAVFFGQPFEIARIGTDGDMQKFRRLIAELDGQVDAFGVGGADIYLYAGGKRYVIPEILRLMEGAKRTPFVDGSGLKHTLERETVAWLQDSGVVNFRDKNVLMVCAVDRFGMAEALAQRAKAIVFGDCMFILGLPVPLRSWNTVHTLGRLLIPLVARLPFRWLYPTGEKQEQITPKFGRWYAWADVIAGDFHLIRRYMPADLRDKIVLTNTTTEADTEELRKRGVRQLITTTPVLEGRSFGTNVMEGVLVTLLGKPPEALTPDDYLGTLKELGWKPTLQEL
jgi:hypothetical protein